MAKHLSEDEVTLCRKWMDEAGLIVVTCHKSPDGDAMGSSLALYRLLVKLGKRAAVVVPDEVASFLRWLPGTDQVVVYREDSIRADAIIREAGLIFSLDYNQLYRTGSEMEKSLTSSKAPFILIDHHQEPGSFAGVCYSDTSSCSTAQLIYRFIVQCGWKDLIDPELAECVYCGIMTDSGSFRFPSVTPETHLIAADLISLGLDHAKVHREVYDTNLQDRLRLTGYALNEKLEVIPECAAALISLSQIELKRFNYRPGDTEGLVNQALSIQGIKFAAFFREGSNEIKVSFRSKGHFDVNQFARKSWHGGGHINAAGGSSTETLEAAIARFKAEIGQIAQQIMQS